MGKIYYDLIYFDHQRICHLDILKIFHIYYSFTEKSRKYFGKSRKYFEKSRKYFGKSPKYNVYFPVKKSTKNFSLTNNIDDILFLDNYRMYKNHNISPFIYFNMLYLLNFIVLFQYIVSRKVFWICLREIFKSRKLLFKATSVMISSRNNI